MIKTEWTRRFRPWRTRMVIPTLGVLLMGTICISSDPYPLKHPANFGTRYTIPADNPLTKDGVYLGRALFYETRLSANNNVSCSSCHLQKLAFTDGLRFSMGVDGTPTKRNSMSIANLLWVRNFFWDGRSNSLEKQAEIPLTDPHEMGQPLSESVRKLQATNVYPSLFRKAFGTETITADHIVKALAQFERTLIPSSSPYDKFLNGEFKLSAQQERGMNLFMRMPSPDQNIRGGNCDHCHGTPKMFKELFHNNGLDSISADPGMMEQSGLESDRGRFRVPTLRNIALTAPYMHDGRFKTLEEVLDHYSDHLRQSQNLSPFLMEVSNTPGRKSLLLTAEEKKDIIAFLNTLTDSTFITNPEFSDPKLSVK